METKVDEHKAPSMVPAARLINEGGKLLLNFKAWKVTHIYREGNQVADYLAAAQSPLGSTIFHPEQLGTELTTLIKADKEEIHVPDRVVRQFGFKQDISCEIERIDRINKRGRQNVDWVEFHGTYLKQWDQREDYIHDFPRTQSSMRYMEWYGEQTVRHITPPPPPRPPHRYIEDNMVPAMQNMSELLARGALLYPNYEEWGRIVVVTNLVEAVVRDMPQPEDDDSYVPSPNRGGLHDNYNDTTGRGRRDDSHHNSNFLYTARCIVFFNTTCS
ncbi:hypothetical protein QJS04_geneDACA020315 [Acorus gramineus]|uniref:RNase H type-1 domain-containing protein n=1 Tax=Acorus gramineus TaxID=55184 RepID=A0AAV9A843_ACOGR|nr:hypothetical protein QJS04_geneDACA020315 [Acorus gramineus]